MKIRVLLVGIVLIITSCLIFYYQAKTAVNTGNILNRISSRVFDFNDIDLQTPNTINADAITLKHNGNVVYKAGKKEGQIENVYGNNFFEIIYENELLAKLTFFKKNNWHTNNYRFIFNNENDIADVQLEVIGPDSNTMVSKYRY